MMWGNAHIAVFLRAPAHAIAHALRSGRMWEVAVRGATVRVHPTVGDFHRQGNPTEVPPVGQ
jgi:hypothetical protein